jgi:heme exporter protein C
MNPHARHLRAMTLATVVMITVGLALSFFYAPQDQSGYVQKIFYIHVPLAIVSLAGFVIGGLFGAMYLRTGDRIWDMRSYCAIHMSLIFSVGGIVAGSIWAKGAWWHWWEWSEPTLVSYLIVILLFCTYQPLRFSIEDPERQARYAAVFSIVGAAFVPLNFIAVRLSAQYVHPRVLNLEGGNLPGKMALAFYVMLIAIGLLFATLMKYEMLAKTNRIETRRLRRRLLGDDDLAPIRRSAAPSA